MTAFQSDGEDSDLRHAYVNEQIMSRRKHADDLLRDAKRLLRVAGQEDRTVAEDYSRKALARYRASLDWAEDSEWEDEAHRRLDSAGRWVRETFGCHLEKQGESYRQTCPVALAHNRIGLSMGGYAGRRICSLCGDDVSECEHLPGTAYLVPGGPDDLGWCRVCCQEACEHEATKLYRVSVVARLSELKITEVSLVSKPAHPEARLHVMSISTSNLQEELGPGFIPGMEVSCDRCLTECEGLIKHELPHA